MNYKSKLAIILLSLAALSACDSSDNTDTIHSNPDLAPDTGKTPDTGITLPPVTTPPVTTPPPVTTSPPITTPPPVTTPPPAATNLAVNGDFETWTDGKPNGWTLIDDWGVAVVQDSTTFKTGLNSGAFTVTATKADFRQSIDGVNGKTYTLSMSIYHTEAGVRVRGYLGGNYSNDYSDPDLVNQWQDYTFEYKATENKVIDFGVRFYSVSDVFDGSEIVYIDNLTLIESGEAAGPVVLDPPPTIVPMDSVALAAYYADATNKTGFDLKTALHNTIKDHTTKSYGDLWTFISTYTLDTYYENDNTILDIYTEIPSASDSYNFTPVAKQCGNYGSEGDCYNREHSMPQSWFIKASPMVSDVHHIFASDGYVNGKRSNHPYGEVASATYTSSNGSQLGSPTTALGYTGTTVFEPIDEFKGDLARAHFYMATRYQDVVGSWEANSDNANAVLDGSGALVFEPWVIAMLIDWSTNDPVSPKELYRNEAAFLYQGNRNPFVDHPEYINAIWGN